MPLREPVWSKEIPGSSSTLSVDTSRTFRQLLDPDGSYHDAMVIFREMLDYWLNRELIVGLDISNSCCILPFRFSS